MKQIKEWVINFGQDGWVINPLNKKYLHLIITSDGVFLDGAVIAKGKLKLMENIK